MTSSPGVGSRTFRLGMALLCGLTLLALLPVVRGAWILDDNLLIVANRRIHELSGENVRFLLTHDLWNLDSSGGQIAQRLVYFRPLVTLSYALDWSLGGGASTQFHVTNMLIHAATTALVGRAVLRWTASVPGALFAAAYFGLHPARAESVAWISGRPDTLAAFGLMVALEGVHASRHTKALQGGLLFALGALIAFGAKETSVLLPLLTAVELGSAGVGPRQWRRSWPMLASLALPLVYLAGRRIWLPMRPFPIVGLDLWTHAGFVLETLGRAGMYLVAPFDLSMGSATITERHGKVAAEPAYLAFGAVLAAALVLLLLRTYSRQRRVFWALLAFLVALLPTLNLIWIGGTAVTSPRFFYLPSVLFAWLLAEVGRGRLQALSERNAAWLSGAFGVCLAPLLALQASVYRDPERFWAGELRSRPDEPMALAALSRQDFRRGDVERAVARGLCRYRLSLERFSYTGTGANILLETLERWTQATADVERDQLLQIADFLRASREPFGPARLKGVIEADVPPGSKVRRELVRSSARSKTLEASLRVRLGQRELAQALVKEALAQCPRCNDYRPLQALTAYRSFDVDLASELAGDRLLDRPARHAIDRLRALNAAFVAAGGEARAQLEVSRLAEVRLPGEALRVLQRHKNEVASEHAKDIVHLELQLAAQAGDGALAEELARELGVRPPPVALSASAERVSHYLTTFKEGCAFPEELE